MSDILRCCVCGVYVTSLQRRLIIEPKVLHREGCTGRIDGDEDRYWDIQPEATKGASAQEPGR